MGIVVRLPQRHARASAVSRAANIVKISAVTPAPIARSVPSTADHHSAGILSLCHHFETADGLAPMSAPIASREGQRSIMDWKEGKWVMLPPIRQLVLKRKDILSGDVCKPLGHDVLMSKQPSDSQFKKLFLARTALARENARYTQETMAAALGIEQSKYSKYEVRTMLPHHLVVPFCSLCEITQAWLYTAAVEIKETKPRKRRARRPPKRLRAVKTNSP